MASTIILSDNGVSSGSAGLKETGGNDGTLVLQTTTAGGAAITTLTLGSDQSVTAAGNLKTSSGYMLGTTGTSGFLLLGTVADTTSGATIVVRNNSSTYDAGGAEFYTGGAERMRIDSSGNVGIGTSSPTDGLLHLNGGTTTNVKFTNAATGTTSADGLFIGLASSADTDGYVFNRESANLKFGTANTERMRIDSSGKVSVGPASSAIGQGIFAVYNDNAGAPATSGSSDAYITTRVRVSSVALDTGVYGSGTAWIQNRNYANYATNYNMVLQPNGASLGVGATAPVTKLHAYTAQSDDNYGIILAESSNGSSSVCAKATTGTTQLFQWSTLGCRIGSRIKNAGNAGDAYFTTGNDTVSLTIYDSSGNYAFRGSNVSDRRLKTDIADLDSTLGQILSMAPKSYHMVTPNAGVDGADSDPQIRYGFIAQEMRGVAPDVVTGNEEEGYLGIDYNGVLSMAVKAIQEQQALIETLTQRIAALENK